MVQLSCTLCTTLCTICESVHVNVDAAERFCCLLYQKMLIEKRDRYTIFEFDFGMDFDEHCSNRGRRSLTKVNDGGNVQSQ